MGTKLQLVAIIYLWIGPNVFYKSEFVYMLILWISGQRFLKWDKGLQICGLGLQIEHTDCKISGTV